MGDESGFATRQRESGRTGGPAVTIEADGLPQLSGRSRALLIRFVEATGAFRRPIGLPTVAFTEAQVYNLRRVLTDETIRMSYSTMERIVTDAVRSTPTTPHQRRPISVPNAGLRRMPEKTLETPAHLNPRVKHTLRLGSRMTPRSLERVTAQPKWL